MCLIIATLLAPVAFAPGGATADLGVLAGEGRPGTSDLDNTWYPGQESSGDVQCPSLLKSDPKEMIENACEDMVFFQEKTRGLWMRIFLFLFLFGSCEPKKVDSWNAKTPPVINQILIFPTFCVSKNLPETLPWFFWLASQASQGFVVQPYELRYLHYRKAGLGIHGDTTIFNGNYYDKPWPALPRSASNHFAEWQCFSRSPYHEPGSILHGSTGSQCVMDGWMDG